MNETHSAVHGDGCCGGYGAAKSVTGVLYPLFGILLPPIIAASAMAMSSPSVGTNALRLNRQVL